jgi:glycosyltransferase involved in cell wall biosynthesis
MLSSEDARADCERFHPASKGRTAVVRFAVPRTPVDAVAARQAADRHGLPKTFFYLPNQFWIHKNHALVIEALAILRARGQSMVVAASGNQSDPRDPDHFRKLKALAEHAGVSDLFRPLGLIPYADVALLMRASTAMINPSLFEGWSTTVEEARSTGTPMILSNLGVHREQAGEGAIYFDPNRPEALADALAGFRPLSGPEREAFAAKAAGGSTHRAAEFGRRFTDLVSEVAG